MTMPHEEARALLDGHRLLLDLAGYQIPPRGSDPQLAEFRARARAILRHYPTATPMQRIGARGAVRDLGAGRLRGESHAGFGVVTILDHSLWPRLAPYARLTEGRDNLDDETDVPLFWSNKDGWVDFECATTFTGGDCHARKLRLPNGGVWHRIK